MWKMFSSIGHQRNAKQNHNKLSPHSSYNGWYQSIKGHECVEDVKSSLHPAERSAPCLSCYEKYTELAQKIKNKFAPVYVITYLTAYITKLSSLYW
jgi:hypothetical protein